MPVNEKLKQYESLMGESWVNKLENFLLSESYTVIKNKVNSDLLSKLAVTPKTTDMFNAFKHCPFGKVRIVIVGQNPYPEAGLATGIAFESGLHKMPAALDYIYSAIEKDIYGGFELNMERSKDLKYLCEQGVLLLNTSLTTLVGQTKCTDVWKPFTEEVFRLLSEFHTGVIYLLWGKEAQSYKKFINEKNNYVFEYSHPTSAFYNGNEWNCPHFSEVNKILTANNGDVIYWDKYFYEESKKCLSM